ncbi:MAG: hypothetical protein AAFO99_12155 [Bacteroidota bacterium]
MTENKTSRFTTSGFLKAIVPSYFFPFVSSGLSGYLLNKPALIHASYSTIALPSLLATALCFGILWFFQEKQILLLNRFAMTLILGVSMTLLAVLNIHIFELQAATWNIVLSALLGTAIVVMTKPLKKHNI